jgi:hypothetical protein
MKDTPAIKLRRIKGEWENGRMGEWGNFIQISVTLLIKNIS